MLVKIGGDTISNFLLEQIQVSGKWDSIYNKGRLQLRSDAFTGGTSIRDDSVFVGSEVEIQFDSDHIVYFKILAFNLLQSTAGSGSSTANALELILISSWYFDSTVRTMMRYGNSSEIAKAILGTDARVETMMDPYRKRYQLGITDHAFLESLRPLMTTDTSAGLLYCSLYDESINLDSYDYLKSQQSIFDLNPPSNPTGSFTMTDSKYYYNEKREIDNLFHYSEITKELQLTELEDLSVKVYPIVNSELLTKLDDGYFHKTDFESWEKSPLEQYALARRKSYLAEIEFHSSVFIAEGTNYALDIGNKITTDANKQDSFRNSIISNDYILRGITFSIDLKDQSSYTKVVAVPIIELD